jgi:hypothetical protein
MCASVVTDHQHGLKARKMCGGFVNTFKIDHAVPTLSALD